jgi:hypothetical protein
MVLAAHDLVLRHARLTLPGNRAYSPARPTAVAIGEQAREGPGAAIRRRPRPAVCLPKMARASSSGGMLVLVRDAAESIPPADV